MRLFHQLIVLCQYQPFMAVCQYQSFMIFSQTQLVMAFRCPQRFLWSSLLNVYLVYCQGDSVAATNLTNTISSVVRTPVFCARSSRFQPFLAEPMCCQKLCCVHATSLVLYYDQLKYLMIDGYIVQGHSKVKTMGCAHFRFTLKRSLNVFVYQPPTAKLQRNARKHYLQASA